MKTKTSTELCFYKESPPERKKQFAYRKTALFLLTFISTFFCSINVHASWENYSDDCFTASYEAAYGRYKITALIHQAEKKIVTYYNGKLDNAMIKVYDDSDKSYKELLRIDADDDDTKGYFDGWFTFQFKNPFGQGRMYDTKGSYGTEIESEINSNRYKKINQPYGEKGMTFKVFYWYPPKACVGKNLKFIMSYGNWSRRRAERDDRINNKWHQGNSLLLMADPSSALSITENNYDADGNNVVTCVLNSYNPNYEKAGSLSLQYSVDGVSWREVAFKAGVSATHTFRGKYVPDNKTSFTEKGYFKVVKSVNLSDGRADAGGIFVKETLMSSTQQKSVFSSFVAKQDDNKITFTWKTEGTNDNTHSDKNYEIYLKKNNGAWQRIASPRYSDTEYTYVVPNEELGVGLENINYEFLIKRSEFKIGSVWDKYLSKSESLNFNPNYKKIEQTSHQYSDNGVVKLNWQLGDGIFPKDNLEYVVQVSGINGERYPDVNATSFDVTGLISCQSYNITLSLRNKSSKTVYHKHVFEDVMIENDMPSVIRNLTISKGYYSDKVDLKWSVPRDSGNFQRFVITRKIIGEANSTPTTLIELTHAINTTTYSYQDNSIEPGVYYLYTVKGEVTCAENTSYFPYSDIGFSQPYGSVAGRIAYEGTQAVPNVDVIVSGDAERSEMINRALEFSSERQGDHYLTIPINNTFPANATIQMWLNMSKSSAEAKTILHLPGILTFDYKNNSFEINGEKISGAEPIEPMDYRHVTLALSGGKIKLYLEGSKVGEVPINATSQQLDNIYIGGLFDPNEDEEALKKTYFDGYIDEIRLWNYAQTETEIKKNFDRYLSGKESGLVSYYRCDEPNDIKGVLFDLSAVKSSFNMNDAILGNAIIKIDDKNKVPSSEMLAIKATTDQYGNFLINTIPYSNEGDVFNITPMYGVHSFSPSSRPVLVGPDSKVHNSIDFTDISSFSVSGKVTYAGTTYPVEGVELVIDGTTVCSKDGEIIKTGEDGKYTISVPIGAHHITARKNGHVFVGDGRFPLDPHGIGAKHVFEKPESGVDFKDNTLITVVGRVAGGSIEKAKPFGFGSGVANIGKATIKLQSSRANSYSLNDSDKELTLDASSGVEGADTIKSVATIKKGEDIITVKTCSESGEFVFKAPPVPLKVLEIFTDGLDEGHFPTDQYSVIEVINPNQTTTDTLTVNGVTKTFDYHASLNVNYTSKPFLEIRDINAKPGAFGDQKVAFTDKAGNKRTISIYTVENDSVDYRFGAPVFTQLKDYTFELYGYELYQNVDDTTNIISHEVPLEDVVVTLANEFGIQQVYNEGANDGEIYELSENQIQLDSLGLAKYTFTAGFPNINDGHTLRLTAQYSYNDRTYIWEQKDQTEGLTAYVFGQLPTGTDFVTEGPDIISMVLRDPPGSQSYAFFEKGTKMSYGYKESDFYSGAGEGKDVIHAGVKLTTGGGIGVVLLSEMEAKADVTLGLDWEIKHSGEHGTINTITTTEKISTSDSPDYVGAMGDVFIGSSNNRVFGKSRNVGIIEDEHRGLSIGVDEITTIRTNFSTAFKYTASHIENNLIPNYYSIRDGLLIQVSESEYNENYPNNTEDVIYITKLDKEHPKFGSDNSDKTVWENQAVDISALAGPSYIMIPPKDVTITKDTIFIDKILWCNTQIQMWKNALADNEEIKLEAIKNKNQKLEAINEKGNSVLVDRLENHSIDAGVTFESSKQSCTETTYEKVHEYTIRAIAGVETGIVIGGLGMTASIETRNGGGNSTTESNSTETCITTGYVLKDENPTDYYSVDVILPIDKTGVVFSTRGGRSSCPYEGEVVSKYFAVGSKLSEATMQVEVPAIRVTNPTATDIPSGKEASYELKLSNASEANQDVTYTLRVLDATNPNGAKLSIDGSVLTTGRDINIKAKETLTKVLKLSQTSVDVLAYDSIGVVLSSSCQTEIADTIFIWAKFIPTCSDISMSIDKRILNDDTNGILSVKINGYDLDYKSLKGIRLQYKSINTDDWSLIREYVIDEEDKSGANSELIDNRKEISINYDTKSLWNDGTYDVRAITMCSYGNELVYNASEVIRIVKDLKAPQSLGTPSPSNGILDPESELSITFNEIIQNNLVDNNRVIIEGVLNGYQVRDNVGLSFDGTGNAYTELEVVNNNSLSIEGWFKRQLASTGTLFSYGTQENSISLSFTNDNKLTVIAGDQTFTSKDVLTDTTWQYVSMTYNRENGNVRVNLLTNQEDVTPSVLGTNYFVTKELPKTGKFYIGSKVDGSNKYNGSVRQVHFWNKERELTDLSDKDAGKSGNEVGLIGYWNLEEGSGSVAEDKARGRNLLLNTGWFVYPTTKSVSFNGTDEYLRLSNERVIFTEDKDFSIEFWFKGDKQNGTILSAGDTIQSSVSGKLSIASNDAGQLLLRTSGSEYIIAPSDVMNDEWHHFAMSVRRQGNTNVYIDGNQTFQTLSQNIGGYTTAYTYLGASSISEEKDESDPLSEEKVIIVNDPFKGMVDEVRIWNSSLTSDGFKLDRNNKLTGKESGLVAYYPFERYIKDNFGQYVIVESLKDQSMNLYRDTLSNLVADGSITFEDFTPVIKDARPKETISEYSLTTSENKIVINLNEPISRIEGCILEFTVKDVMDANGNKMSPKKWTAYVDMNRLQWTDNKLSLEKNVYEPLSFKAHISNNSGVNETYSITNIPSWLVCSSAHGTLKPQQTQEIEFTVDESVEIGKYEVGLLLSGNNNYAEALVFSLKVNGEKPDWSVNPNNYSSTMNLVSQLKIENIYQEDTEDIVAAFINGECRGVVSPQYVKNHNSYYVFMDIYGNESDDNEQVIFQLWDASTGRTYSDIEVSQPIGFVDNTTIGTIANPVILNALDIIEQQINLKEGWNWISVNTVAKETPLLDIFKAGVGDAGEMLKYKTAYIQAPTWSGNLATIDNDKMYNVRANKARLLKFKGMIADPAKHPISLTQGWNWIGYVPTFSLPINSALAGIDAKEGDQIKGQTGFALYVEGSGWLGSLSYLTAGKGYMYNLQNESATLIYPSKMISSASLRSAKKSLPVYWTPESNKYQDNMTLTSVISIDGEELRSEDYEIAMFDGDECRGTVRLKYEEAIDRYLAYLLVHGDTSDELNFRLYNHTTKKAYSFNKSIMFKANAIYGSPTDPYVISFDGGTGVEDEYMLNGIKAYPNPVSDILYIDGLQREGEYRYAIYGMDGRAISSGTITSQKNSIDVSMLASAFYIIELFNSESLVGQKLYFVKK